MKVSIRLTPYGDGRWHWSLGRGGTESTNGDTESYETARTAAEDAAKRYAREVGRTTSYLYDTETEIRIPVGGE